MSDRPTIIAVDPGLTTGWAVLYPDGEFRSGETKGPYAFLKTVYGLLRDRAFDWHLVVEKYTITPETIKKSRQTDALEIIGALKFFAAYYDAGWSMQMPSEAKAFASDGKLRRIGWFRQGLGHANDASRHLMCYAVRNKFIDAAKLLEGGS